MSLHKQLLFALAASLALVVLGLSVDSKTPGYAAGEDESKEAVAQADQPLRFGHDLHKGKGVKIEDCETCHGIKGVEVQPVTRGKDHSPCNAAGCHASEYMSREPKICVVCHETNEPWVKQTARIRDLYPSEFGGDFSHKSHLKDAKKKVADKCMSCHGAKFEGKDPPDSHSVCGSCHQGELRPLMNQCGGCHKLGYAEELQQSRSKYSVRARFDHEDHDNDPRKENRGNEPDCKVCHSDVTKAETLKEIPPPTMQSCDACHDGKLAFKTTGFGCVKCHGDAAP